MPRAIIDFTDTFIYTNAVRSEEDDMIEVTSLPSVGGASATQLYKLSKDNKLYFKDSSGALWRPVDQPGWPRRDASEDEEWEGANADPPSGWTYDNHSVVVADVNNLTPSLLRMSATSGTSGRGAYLYKTASSPTNKRYYAPITVLPVGSSATYGGLFVRNNSNGRLICLLSSHIGEVLIQKNTDSSTFNANALTADIELTRSARTMLAIENDGTNIVFRVASGDSAETDWRTVYSETIATYITSFDQVGYCLQTSSSGAHMLSDWFRVVGI